MWGYMQKKKKSVGILHKESAFKIYPQENTQIYYLEVER